MATPDTSPGLAVLDRATDGHIHGYASKAYRGYVLNALLLTYILNFLDRGLLGIVAEPLMNDLRITDGQFGLLTGIGFALLYSAIGIPLAHVAETRSRVIIMSVCIVLWSAATAGSGLARPTSILGVTLSGFFVLFVMRVFVGIGEAGCTPPANSLIADYYPPAQRSTALGYYAMGVTGGTLLANLIGGQIAAAFGWRMSFYVIGIAGVFIAFIFMLTVKEPPRGYSDPPGAIRPPKANFTAALSELASKPSFWLMAVGATLASFCGYGMTTFQTAFLMRAHGLSLGDATLLFNVPIAAAGSFGVVMTGWIAEKIVKKHPNGIAWLSGVSLLLCVVPYLLGFSSDNKWIALIGISLGAMFRYSFLAAQYTIAQGVVGVRSRATAIAILLLIVNLFGYGLGPAFIGYVSDVVFGMQASAHDLATLAHASCKGSALKLLPQATQTFCRAAEASSLRTSLEITSVLYFVPAAFFFLCTRTLQKDLVAK